MRPSTYPWSFQYSPRLQVNICLNFCVISTLGSRALNRLPVITAIVIGDFVTIQGTTGLDLTGLSDAGQRRGGNVGDGSIKNCLTMKKQTNRNVPFCRDLAETDFTMGAGDCL
jgi:hypothetical protein